MLTGRGGRNSHQWERTEVVGLLKMRLKELPVDNPRMIVGDSIEVESIRYNYIGGEHFNAGDVLTTKVSGLSSGLRRSRDW